MSAIMSDNTKYPTKFAYKLLTSTIMKTNSK
jgi:hypothetical protein